jgi:hypothetical protein
LSWAVPLLLVRAITSASAALTALVTAPVAVCSSEALSTDLELLVDVTAASAASNSSIDMLSSSVLAFTTVPSSPEEASVAVASLSEAVSAASISASSSLTSSTTALKESVLSFEDDELSKFSYIRKKDSVKMLSLLKVKCHS